MNVPMLDLKAQYATIREEIEAAVAEVFESQHFILGPKVAECEEAVAAYCGAKEGVGLSSGSDALLVALMALGVKPGDEIITTPYSFFATAGSIFRLGAKVVFVDIDPETCNIDRDKIAEKVTPKTRGVMPVHLFGQVADMDPILDLARAKGLFVVEDAAQAIGAEYKGRRAGGMGDVGCFSFFPSKNLGAAGDGGMAVTGDKELADRMRILRDHGQAPRYHHKVVGGNFRLDALQAAVVSVKLKHLDGWTAARQANAERYGRLFAESGLLEEGLARLPKAVMDRHIFNQYVIRVGRRDEVLAHLQAQGIGCAIYYPVPLHLQECFASLGHSAGDMPVSEKAAEETLALPVYPELDDEQAATVVGEIRAFLMG